VIQSALTAILALLGQTPNEVAANFQAHGIQDIRNTVRFYKLIVCYLQAAIGLQALTVDVIQGDRARIVWDEGSQDEVMLSAPVLLFLQAFHQGAGPELCLL
jgi:hypothetical protein